MPRSYLPRSYLGGLGVRAGSVIDRVCSEPSGRSQNWVTSQTSTTTCPVGWNQVSFFLVKPSGALRLLAAPRLSFVLQFQEAKERSDTKSRMPKLLTGSLNSSAGSPRGKARGGGVSWVLGPRGSPDSRGETCTATTRLCQELCWGLEAASLSTTLGLSNLYFC